MKEVNLLSLVHASKNLEPKLLSKYMNYLGVSLKSSEIDDLRAFVENLIAVEDHNIFENFYLGYTIPQMHIPRHSATKVAQYWSPKIQTKKCTHF